MVSICKRLCIVDKKDQTLKKFFFNSRTIEIIYFKSSGRHSRVFKIP